MTQIIALISTMILFHRTVDRTLRDFVGGLGLGQVVSRQTLATSSLGDIEVQF